MAVTTSAALAVAFVAPAAAWTRMNYREQTGFQDRDLRVPGGRLAFEIEQDGAWSVTDGSDIAAIRAAFDAINAVPTSSAEIVDAGRFDYPASVGSRYGLAKDGKNRIYFFDEDDPTFPVVALTTVFFEVETGTIVEADIAVNDADYDLSTATPSSENEPLGTHRVDVGEVVAHECMHALGFAHSAVVGEFDPATGCQVGGWYSADFSHQATMFPYATGTTAGRSLGTDDVAALSAVYPSGSSTGTIFGEVVDGATGRGIKGAHVVAVSVTEPDVPLVGTISGTGQGLSGGNFRLAGLQPGDYYVRIEPFAQTSNPFKESATTYSGFRSDFEPEFYSGALESSFDAGVDSSDAAWVHVEPGGVASSVDFVTNVPPQAPVVSKAIFKNGKLKIAGSGFMVDATVCEVDGRRIENLKFPKKSITANGYASKIVSKDRNLSAQMAGAAQLVVVNTMTGQRSAPMPVDH